MSPPAQKAFSPAPRKTTAATGKQPSAALAAVKPDGVLVDINCWGAQSAAEAAGAITEREKAAIDAIVNTLSAFFIVTTSTVYENYT